MATKFLHVSMATMFYMFLSEIECFLKRIHFKGVLKRCIYFYFIEFQNPYNDIYETVLKFRMLERYLPRFRSVSEESQY